MVWLFLLFVALPVIYSEGEELTPPQNVTRSPCTDMNHLFLAPGVLTAGGSNRACVSRFYTDGTARMLLTLVTDDLTTTTASRELPSGDGGCIDIAVPQKPNTKAKLTVNLWYPEAQCSWERDLSVRISSGRLLVIHTERARYHPGEILRARVLALKADLTPAHGAIEEIWLEGPRGAWAGTRAAQWRNVRVRMGFAQVQHSLDELAPPGRWSMHARLGDGTQGSTAFMVGNYELPPFQLSVRHAQKVLRTSDRLVWTVCVRYPWTEAVEGMLVIRIRGAGGTSVGHEPSGIRTVVRIKAPRACHRHAAASRRIGLNGTYPPEVVVADFSFQEDDTRIWQNTTVVSQVVDKPITLQFLTKHRAIISPRLPYKLKVKATRWDEKPASGVTVRVCRGTMCPTAETDAWGVARVTFTAGYNADYHTFQASLANDSSVTALPLQVAVRRTGLVHAALGPIKPDTESGKTVVPLYVDLTNVTKPLTVHFVVITRGGIIYRWGATTQCPSTSSSEYIPTTSRESECHHANIAYYDRNIANFNTISHRTAGNFDSFNTISANSSRLESDSLLDRHLLRVMLPIKVTHQMCPDSHLVAFFYYKGELVSASKHFELDECFINKVELTWSSRQVAPGSTANLQISTTGPALCALTVLDSAAKWNQPSTSVKEVLITELKRLIQSHRNLTEYDAAGTCFLTSELSELPTNSMELTASWLAAAGVRITGGELTRVTRNKCASGPAPLIDDATVPRSDFSEAWLWRLVAVGANGTAIVSGRASDTISRFEAAATCVSRSGLAHSAPGVLQVFREFFIHADSPRRLKQGDSTIIRYRLFNYLYESLSVQIQIMTDSHLEGPTESVEAACVNARASIARRVEISAKSSGEARLSIRAKSVQDGNCANGTIGRTGVSDEVIIQISIEPEGVLQQEHKSILLCGRGSPEASSSEITWSFPAVEAVPGTESLTVWASGDLTGPLLADSDALVTLPRGCGEQNMARLATNLLALTQLRNDSSAATIAASHLARGFTRQFQYLHPQGGFSAFGGSDPTPSTWLTAFSLKYMRRAHQILNPGLPLPPSLELASRWLLAQQMENGCFRAQGQVFHTELKGGLNEEGEIASVALTAFVITSLLESSAPISARVLHNTLSCLRALPPGKARVPSRVYAQALLGYAFMKIRAYEDEIRKTNEASLLWERREAIGGGLKEDEELRELMELLKLARRTGDYVYWETSSLSSSIEATGYALMALSSCGARCASDARACVRWLSAHRHAAGGFLSTQDTLVALEALSMWSAVQPSTPPSLNVRVRSKGDLKTAFIQAGEKVPQVMKMTPGDQLDVSVEGLGCALVQASRSYHSVSDSAGPTPHSLAVQVRVRTDGVFDCDANKTMCFCAAEIEACVRWSGGAVGMRVLEVRLPATAAADAARLYSQLKPPHSLLRRIELTPSGGRATFYLDDTGMESETETHACYYVHAIAPKTKTKPAYARVTDYYNPTINHTQMYTIPEDCPPRIAHENNEFTASDNLFNKARSLSDSSEIVITHEYSFEDIPDGIPLEDPLYDSFNREEIAYLSKHNDHKHKNNNFMIINNVNHKSLKRDGASEEKEKDITDKLGTNIDMNESGKNADVTSKDIFYAELKSAESDERNSLNTDRTNVTNEVDKSAFTDSETSNSFDIISSAMNKDNLISKENITLVNYVPSAKTHENYDDNRSNNGVIPENLDSTRANNESVVPKEVDNVNTLYVNHEAAKDYSVNENVGFGVNKKQTNMDIKVQNPKLSAFHVVNSQTDLDVPTGIEGPVPSIVLPPPNFVIPPPDISQSTVSYSRRFPIPPQNLYYFPYQHPGVYYRERYYPQNG
ncbi:unnamed protein product [Chilo suppressalis]|uniref:Alpha-2-macroglobulin domain-containing protein n=1 Tax=Chilo suppressalis TaxID=168631 RepID=A0ABN8B5Q2_CHISP|nr:unnamed protein product [Chilo suppressalis]